MGQAKDVLNQARLEPFTTLTGFPPSHTRPVSRPPPLVYEFRTVYREHFRFVWRSLRRLGLPEQDCADAAQQVFMVVHRKLDEFRENAKLTTWLFAICANIAANARRSRGRRNETDLDGELPPSAASAHARSDARLTIERLLDGMPLEQRTTFLLFEIEELSCQEIAAVTNTPTGTVKSRLRLARERVAAKLGLELPEEGKEIVDE